MNLSHTEEALPESVCQDLNIDDLCERVDYTSSCIGRQYLYHILCTDKVSDVARHEPFIEQLQADHQLRNQLVNALQKLNKADAYSIVDILAEEEHAYSRGYLLLLQLCRWLPALFLILIFQIPASPVPFLCLLVSYLLNGYLHFINLLTAKTLHTCFAKEFRIDMHRRLYSVIHTEDNLPEGKSYFFQEVENVKAALEKGKEGKYLLIFDELFKGTNTMERIAINHAVLSALAKADNLVLASTHDLELTDLLHDQYELYHFSETIAADKLRFDYKLKRGAGKEGNAIWILELCGYPSELVRMAKDVLRQREITRPEAEQKHMQ